MPQGDPVSPLGWVGLLPKNTGLGPVPASTGGVGTVSDKMKVTTAEVSVALSPLPGPCPAEPRQAWMPLSCVGKHATAQISWAVLLPLG